MESRICAAVRGGGNRLGELIRLLECFFADSLVVVGAKKGLGPVCDGRRVVPVLNESIGKLVNSGEKALG